MRLHLCIDSFKRDIEEQKVGIAEKNYKVVSVEGSDKGNWLETAWKRHEDSQEECNIVTWSCEWDGGEDHCTPVAK